MFRPVAIVWTSSTFMSALLVDERVNPASRPAAHEDRALVADRHLPRVRHVVGKHLDRETRRKLDLIDREFANRRCLCTGDEDYQKRDEASHGLMV